MDQAWREEHDGVKIISSTILSSWKVIHEKYFPKNVLFLFGDLSYLQY